MSAQVANHQKHEMSTQKVLHTRHFTLVEKVTRRNHRDKEKDFDDVDVKHRHRAARLVLLEAERQPQVNALVERRHQLL